jgi:two-component system heavy metal sensor histidine kinase CusS
MLDRLEQAFENLQRFTADAAHELRAPLALMRTQVEVTLRRQRAPAEYVAGYRFLMGEIERLSRLADQLFLLARADAGALVPERAPLDLSDLVEEVVERWRPMAREREARLQGRTVGTGMIAADEELLRRVLDNLIDNGLRHTPRGGSVTVEARHMEREWQIVVHDTGPGVEPGVRPRLFERFARADAARARATGGAGLGLSLCAAIVNAHGGSIALEEAATGARFVPRLPTVGQA